MKLNPRQKAQLASVKDLLGHPGFVVNTEVEGFKDYQFGCQSFGDVTFLGYLLHEVAHCAQLKPHELARVTSTGWGFSLRRTKFGYPDIQTHGPIERECEVVGIQLQLERHLGLFDRIEKWVGPLDVRGSGPVALVPGWINVPTKGDTHDERELNRKLWARERTWHWREHWTVDAIVASFRRNLTEILERRPLSSKL